VSTFLYGLKGSDYLYTKLLAIDAATGTSGIAVFINGEYSKSYKILSTSTLKGEAKLNEMIELLNDELHTEDPDIVIVEEIMPTRNAMVTRMLQELTGALRGLCINSNIDYHEMKPSEYRSVIVKKTGQKPKGCKREDQKAWSIDIANNQLGISTDDDNISDAILLGTAYVEMCK